MTLMVGTPHRVRRAREGAPQHSAPVPPLRVEHLPQRVVAGSQEERLSPTAGLCQIDVHLKSRTVNPYVIWVEAPGGISHMVRKKKQGSTHPYPNPNLLRQGGVSKLQ